MRIAAVLCLAAAFGYLQPVAARAMGDASNGETVFRKCKACHQVGAEAKQRTGPILNGIVGAQIATRDGFAYSDALSDLGTGGATWTENRLDAFLERPRKIVPGTKMTFSGLRKPSDRADVIAYLATFTASDDAAAGFAVEPDILALSGDPEYGEYLSSECTTCHQADGSADGIPPIVGLGTEAFVTAMHAYRGGAREHQVMQMITGRLSDEEIASLAAYFESLRN